ncbi:MAG: xylulokinase [Candidatus Bathyarchaeia archaeon]
MSGPYLAGVDVGTTGLKAAVFDLEGRVVAEASRAYPVFQPQMGWAEQDPEQWWNAFREAVGELTRKVEPSGIASIAVDSQCPSLVPVKADGQPLRNAMLWLDRRSVSQAEWIKRTVGEQKIVTIAYNRVAAGALSAPGMLWIREHEPQVFEAARWFLHANGYITLKLIGRATMDWANASFTLLFNVARREWSRELCDLAGIPVEKLPEAVAPWVQVGWVSTEAARETGLRQGTPVVAGTADSAAAALGVGAVHVGDSMDSSGASTVLGVCVDKPLCDRRFMVRAHAIPDRWLFMAPSSATGASLRWFRDNLYRHESRRAEELQLNAYQLMDLEAERSPPGAKGLVFLPYLAGERAPIWDPDAKGLLYGLTLSHTRADVIRAIMEGAVYALRHNLELMETLGLQIETIRLTGGHAKSRLWRQIKADITGRKVIVTAVKEAAALGSAMLAAVGVGFFKNPVEASECMVHAEEEVEPNLELQKTYMPLFNLYKRLYRPELKLSRYGL